MSIRRIKKIESETKSGTTASLDSASILKIRRILLKWGRNNYRPYPWRNTERPWHGLLAEVLLQRTRAESVVRVYQQFVSKYPTPSDLAKAPLSEIEYLIYPLGLRWRAPLIQKLGIELDKRRGTPPSSLDELKLLPGVGPYAAAAYLAFHTGKRAVIIDANIVRWICRLLYKRCDGETRRKKWLIEMADCITPENNAAAFNYSLLDFTMTICARIPRCHECPLGAELCLTGRKVLSEGDKG